MQGDPTEPKADVAGPAGRLPPSREAASAPGRVGSSHRGAPDHTGAEGQDPSGHRRRPPDFSPAWRRVWLLVGGVQLVSSVPRLLRGAWLPGAVHIGIGLAVLSLAIVPGLLPALSALSVRPVSGKRTRRRAAWIRAHPVQSTIVLGLSWGLGCAALSGQRDGNWPGWPISLAFWLPGGLVYGLIMVQWMNRRTPPAMETAVDSPLSPR